MICPVFFVGSVAHSAVLGREKPAVNIVEDHSEVLCYWYKAGKRNVTAINVDAHNDFFSPGRQFDHDIPKIKKIFAENECTDIPRLLDSTVHRGDLFTIGDYLHVAYRLGVIKELWWVIPTKNRLPRAEFAPFKTWFQEKWSIPQEFMDSLRYDGKIMRGNFRGMPVRMVTLEDLPSFPEEVLLTVDVDYFPELNLQPTDSSMLQLLEWFFNSLNKKNLKSPMVEISTSVRGYYTPLRFKYLAQRVKEWLEKPAKWSASPPESYLAQEAFESAMREKDYSMAMVQANRLVKLQPDSPVPYYDMTLIHMVKGDIESGIRALETAVSKDSSYQHGYISLSRTLYFAGKEEEAFQVLSHGLSRHPENHPLMELVGRYHLDRKEYAKAETVYRKLLKNDPNYLFGEVGLGEALFRLGKKEQAKAYFDSVVASLPPGELKETVLEEWMGLSAEGRDPQATEKTDGSSLPKAK